ncbi:MAG: hypothetical protein JRI68_17890, partial [Deltaproteobacteria bacterium]|nr:hypothetical protein [Deltaproteobacteria bacterium]
MSAVTYEGREQQRLLATMMAAAAVAAGCSSEQDSSGVCSIGAEQTCSCPAGATGTQRCASDGSSWGSCLCGVGGGGGTGGSGASGGNGGSMGGGGSGGEGNGMPTSEYELPVTPPACAQSDPEVRLIETVTDWQDINDPSYRIFCVAPGDYTTAGTIQLQADGQGAAPRWIRYYDANDPTDDRHPVDRANGEHAVVAALRFEDADFWIVHGLTQRGLGNWTSTQLNAGSEHNVLNRMLIEDGRVTIRHGAHHNTVQNSMFREAPLAPQQDRIAI